MSKDYILGKEVREKWIMQKEIDDLRAMMGIHRSYQSSK